MSIDHSTATRATLSAEWKEMRTRVDWMMAPEMANYVNSLVSGKPLDSGGHWAIYARDMHIKKLFERRCVEERTTSGLSMLSLACGSGHIENALIKTFDWPINNFLGLEYDDSLRKHAAHSFAELSNCNSTFEFFDFNAPNYVKNQFDIIFTCHSIHHATDLESMMKFINGSLKVDGIFIGIDYFGPTRFQIEHDVFPIIKELFDALPPDLRRDLRDPKGNVTEQFLSASIDEVRNADISESVRSSDLRTLLFATFPVIDLKPMGGTLLRWLLQYRAGNFRFDVPEHVCIIRLLQIIERELIILRRIKSDDLFFVLHKSDRL